jgi:hypothetical protein
VIDAYVVGGQRSYHLLPISRSFYEALIYSSLQDVHEIIGPTRGDIVRNIIGFYSPLTIWWERSDFCPPQRRCQGTQEALSRGITISAAVRGVHRGDPGSKKLPSLVADVAASAVRAIWSRKVACIVGNLATPSS